MAVLSSPPLNKQQPLVNRILPGISTALAALAFAADARAATEPARQRADNIGPDAPVAVSQSTGVPDFTIENLQAHVVSAYCVIVNVKGEKYSPLFKMNAEKKLISTTPSNHPDFDRDGYDVGFGMGSSTSRLFPKQANDLVALLAGITAISDMSLRTIAGNEVDFIRSDSGFVLRFGKYATLMARDSVPKESLLPGGHEPEGGLKGLREEALKELRRYAQEIFDTHLISRPDVGECVRNTVGESRSFLELMRDKGVFKKHDSEVGNETVKDSEPVRRESGAKNNLSEDEMSALTYWVLNRKTLFPVMEKSGVLQSPEDMDRLTEECLVAILKQNYGRWEASRRGIEDPMGIDKVKQEVEDRARLLVRFLRDGAAEAVLKPHLSDLLDPELRNRANLADYKIADESGKVLTEAKDIEAFLEQRRASLEQERSLMLADIALKHGSDTATIAAVRTLYFISGQRTFKALKDATKTAYLEIPEIIN